MTKVVIAAFIILVLAAWILSWYRQKELRDMRTLDLSILALDNGSTFAETDSDFVRVLNQKRLAFTNKGNVTLRNFIGVDLPTGRGTIFDFSYVTGGKNKKTVHLNAVQLRLDGRNLPPARIMKRQFLDWLIFEGYPRIQSDKVPHWINSRVSIFAPSLVQKQVLEMVQRIRQIQTLIEDRHFRGLTCNGEYVVLYFLDQYAATETGYWQMRQRMTQLESMFDSGRRVPPQDSVDTADGLGIKVLKRQRAG